MENFVFGLIAKEDLSRGYGTFSATLPDGTVGTLNKIGIHTFMEILNVKDFGAVGNGIADDTAAIQAALDVAGAYTVFLPRGGYKITSDLLMRQADQMLVGAGRNFATIKNYGTGSGITVTAGRCNLIDFTVDGSGNVNSGVGIDITGGFQIHVIRCILTSNQTGVVIDNVNDCNLQTVYCDGNREYGIELTRDAHAVKITNNCLIQDNGNSAGTGADLNSNAGGIHVTGGYNITIRDSVIQSNNVVQVKVGSSASSVRGLQIDNNYIESTGNISTAVSADIAIGYPCPTAILRVRVTNNHFSQSNGIASSRYCIVTANNSNIQTAQTFGNWVDNYNYTTTVSNPDTSTAEQAIDDISWPLDSRTAETTIKRRCSINNRDGAGSPFLTRTILTSNATGEWMVSGMIAITRNSGAHGLYPIVAGRTDVGAAYFADMGSAVVNVSAPTAPQIAWSGNNLQVSIAEFQFASVDLIVVNSSSAHVPGVLTFAGLMGGQ